VPGIQRAPVKAPSRSPVKNAPPVKQQPRNQFSNK
jgi:hypothetical protein